MSIVLDGTKVLGLIEAQRAKSSASFATIFATKTRLKTNFENNHLENHLKFLPSLLYRNVLY